MKLHIAVCDDEPAEIEYLSGLARSWAAGRTLGIHVSCYNSAEAFLFAYDANPVTDILLLDIKMKRLDGLTLARRLRAGGSRMQIVFITGLPELIAQGYEVSALHYLMKPVSPEKLFAVLDKALSLTGRHNEAVLVNTADGQAKLALQDIVYAESFAHTTGIQTVRGYTEARIPLSVLEAALGDAFFRCHRSYIAGLLHVLRITRADVILDNGKHLPLSRRRYDAANHAFIAFYRGAE